MRILACFVALSVCAAPAFADDLDALGKAVDANPDDPNAYDAFAKAALKAGRVDDCIHRVKIGVARIPSYGQGYYWLAFAYRKKREWADAADYYRRYIQLNPTKTDPYFGLGAALEGLGDTKGAIAAYDKYVAIEKAPEKQHFVELARQELVKLDPSRAPKPVAPPPLATPLPAPMGAQPTAASAPPSPEALQLRAAAEQLQRDGKLDDAIGAYQRAINSDPNNVELYNSLGNVYFALKRYGEAARAFREAVSRDPLYALGWYNLAHAYRKGDQKREAVDAYRQYMRLKPDDPDPYYGLGQTLKALGDVNGAIDAFRKYIAMEKRPDEQRWVDKARAELQALEAMQRPAQPSGRIDDKSTGDETFTGTAQRIREQPDSGTHVDADHDWNRDDLLNPFEHSATHDLRDPFEAEPPISIAPSRRTLRDYGAAIEAYRRALSRQAEDVSLGYERGVELSLADDAKGATRAWNLVKLDDPRVDAARRSVERVRQALASRK